MYSSIKNNNINVTKLFLRPHPDLYKVNALYFALKYFQAT